MKRVEQPRVSQLGTFAALFEAPGDFTLQVQERIWQMVERLSSLPGVVEAVAGVTNVMLIYEQPVSDLGPVCDAFLKAWRESASAKVPEGRCIEIAATYGGRHGQDLVSVAQHVGLDVAEVVRLHAGSDYRVFAIGSQPGFAYLGGLNPMIALPRKAVPVLHVAAGTVVIGGVQAGVVASAGPNGWHAIGHTDVKLFDAAADPPTLLRGGDRVRFRCLGIER